MGRKPDETMPRRPRRDDVGSSVVEVAVLLPLMLGLLMMVVQAGLWFHVRAVMTTAANKGVDATRVDGGSAEQGEEAVADFLGNTEALDDVQIEVERGSDTARVEVSGEVVSLLFGVPLPITVEVAAPIEDVAP